MKPGENQAKRGTNERALRGVLWILVYLLLVAFPLVVLLAGHLPKGGGFWWDFSMGLGFAGLAMMGLQFVLTARFRRATAPFGIDIIYYFHRLAAMAGVGLILVHYGILRTRYGDALGPASPTAAPWHMTAGRVSLLLFLVLIVSSVWRRQMRIEYDRWRIWHGILATVGVALAVGHVLGVGHYTKAPGKQITWIAFSVFWLLVLGYIRVLKPWRLLRTPYRVASVQPERNSSWTLLLEPDGPHELKFKPGQFAWLTLGTSPFRAKEHPFSFSGSAATARTLQFTIKELGDFTRTIGSVKPGTTTYVDGPHGVFTTDHYPEAPGFGFVAGGVGIAPIMSMLRTLADRQDPRPLRLVFGNATWDRVLFREELKQLTNRLKLEVTHVLQEPPPDWNGFVGMVNAEVLRQIFPEEMRSYVYFVCGPKGMTDLVQRVLREQGVPLHRIHFELFEMV